MHILSILSLCYVIQFSNCEGLSNLLGHYLGFRRLCLCRCGVEQSHRGVLHSRMIGGEHIQPNQMPWLVYIHTNKTTVPGTLISDRHVITSASVVYELLPSKVSVTLGSNDVCEKASSAINASVEAILINPNYTPSRRNNDLALLKLRNDVSFSEYIAPICMPLYDISTKPHLVEVATVASYNKTLSTCIARKATLSILSERSCLTYANASLVSPDKGCLGPVGAPGTLCESDVGSPVMTRLTSINPYRLIGLVSTASCHNNEPPLYTRIIDHLPWISENIRRDCQCL